MPAAATSNAPVWLQPDGKPVSCAEKIKVLNENFDEIRTMIADAVEDGVLMGCDRTQLRAAFQELIDEIEAPASGR